ncbi:hypothetical protein [Verrucomicrobium spinosum]|uniref:hypothetical protein n=1 Tax=Verrucomicrobium spinosum TaxID=2736 RepID=UPI0012E312A2|nr:hypothetical protein [Verrucomicrobium spinosum]
MGFVFDPNAWTRVTGGGSPHFQGGGSTLRIGSVELTPFNSPGTRASDLLDILCLDEKKTFKGLVNVNSTSPEVIRSLVAGVEIRSERAMVNGVETSTDGIVRNGGVTGGSVFHPCSNINTGAGSVLAKGISDLAAANPGTVLATPGDLSALMVANPSSPSTQIPYFGNVNTWPTVATADIPSLPPCGRCQVAQTRAWMIAVGRSSSVASCRWSPFRAGPSGCIWSRRCWTRTAMWSACAPKSWIFS